jgi:hypothetical protein
MLMKVTLGSIHAVNTFLIFMYDKRNLCIPFR